MIVVREDLETKNRRLRTIRQSGAGNGIAACGSREITYISLSNSLIRTNNPISTRLNETTKLLDKKNTALE